LNKSSAEAFNNKVSLIYEFNKTSPLFIRKAEVEMRNNHIERAIEILNAGLKLYPDYAAAHLLLGKAWYLTGHFDEALKFIRSGCSYLTSSHTYEYYLKEIEAAKKQKSLFDSSERTSFFDVTDDVVVTDKSVPKHYELGISEKTKEELIIDRPIINVDDHLEEIAQKISSSRLREPRENFNYETSSGQGLGESSMIVSETLARIYITQGEFTEALGVYRKLIQKNPSKREYYQQKISEIQSKIE
jgi:tetratricopeptide (TPR) repeat protein